MKSSATRSRARTGELIPVLGHEVHVRVEGPEDGKPVLLLHGFEGSLHWWDALTPLLTDTYRVVRPDLLGFGCTGGSSGFDQDGQGDMLAGLLIALDIEDVAVVGHSWGADAALAVAARTERVSEVVILDQAPDLSYLTVTPGAPVLAFPPIAMLVQHLAPAPALRRALSEGFARGFDLDAAVPGLDQMIRDHRAMSWRAYHQVSAVRRRALAANPLDRQLEMTELPALVVHGRHDRLYDWERTRDRYTAVGARFELIDEAGHSPNVETPDRLAAILRDFLATSQKVADTPG
ncbi:alpha/beta fold hydrolase [Nocardia sp. NPDC055321]